MDQVGDTLVQGQFTRHLASRTPLSLCPNDTELAVVPSSTLSEGTE